MSTPLGDAVAAILTGGQAPPAAFADQLDAVVRAAGSNRAAARLMGVGEASIRRWRAGQASPTPASRAVVQRGAQVVHAPRQDQFALKVTDKPSGGSRGRVRTLKASNLKLAPGTVEKAGKVYARTGDGDAAAAVVMDGIRDGFYRRWLAGIAPDPADYAEDLELMYEDHDAPDGDYGAAAAGPG